MQNRRCVAPRVACPCCGWEGHAFRALDIGHWVLPQIECPQCGAHDRHRMMQLVLERHPPEFLHATVDGGTRLLHIAPEALIQRHIMNRPGVRNFATDLQPGAMAYASGAKFACDLHEIAVHNDVFDGMFCVHVLEHIRDDRRALSEMRRVLRPGGVAVIMVPFAPIPRSVEFARPDPLLFYHVRDYAIGDFSERLTGFEVEEVPPGSVMTEVERVRFQIPVEQVVYFCRRPGQTGSKSD